MPTVVPHVYSSRCWVAESTFRTYPTNCQGNWICTNDSVSSSSPKRGLLIQRAEVNSVLASVPATEKGFGRPAG